MGHGHTSSPATPDTGSSGRTGGCTPRVRERTTRWGTWGERTLAAPIVGGAPTIGGEGYYEVGADGGVYTFGDASFYGSTGALRLNSPIVGMTSTADGGGYWLVAADGGIFSFGDAKFYGSVPGVLKPGQKLNSPIVGISSSPDGAGYWLVAADGGIFSFGDAPFYGSTGAIHLNKPIVGMAEAQVDDGLGYYLVASDGGIFSFGDAPFYGSTGAIHLNKPIVGMAVTTNGLGYYLVASDGGIFSFGNASFEGSEAGSPIAAPIVGMSSVPAGYQTVSSMVATPDDKGYVQVDVGGDVYTYGDALFEGSPGGNYVPDPVFGIAATADGKGYWLLGAGGELYTYGDAVNYGTQSTSALDDPVIGIVATSDGKGYWEYTPDGDVYPFGDAQRPRLAHREAAQPTDRRYGRHVEQQGLLVGRLRRGDLHLWRCDLQRVPGRPEPGGPDRGHRGDPGRRGLLAGGQHGDGAPLRRCHRLPRTAHTVGEHLHRGVGADLDRKGLLALRDSR